MRRRQNHNKINFLQKLSIAYLLLEHDFGANTMYIPRSELAIFSIT